MIHGLVILTDFMPLPSIHDFLFPFSEFTDQYFATQKDTYFHVVNLVAQWYVQVERFEQTGHIQNSSALRGVYSTPPEFDSCLQ